MKRSVLSTAAFTITFGFSVLLVGLIFGFPSISGKQFGLTRTAANDSAAEKIDYVLEKDRKHAQIRDIRINKLQRSVEGPVSPGEFASIINRYAADIERIDRTELPAEFRSAWISHVKAWRKYAMFLDTIETNSEFSFEHQAENRRLNAEIERTWYDALSAGYKSGSRFVD